MNPIPAIAPESTAASTIAKQPKASAEAEAARQFEAIFVRQMLSSLEHAQGMGGKQESGSAVYGSMMVNAVADMVTQGDGIGLSAIVLEALSQKHAPKPPTETQDIAPAAATLESDSSPAARKSS